VSALLKRSRRGDPDGQTQGSAPTPERCHVGVSPVHPGCGSAGMGAFVGTIRMGRHRGLPLHSGTQPQGRSGWADTGVCPYTGTQSRGAARSIQAAGALGWAHSWGLSGWADTGVCPYTGPQSRGDARSIQVSAARHYLDGQAQGPAPTLEKLQEIVDELNNRAKNASDTEHPMKSSCRSEKSFCVRLEREWAREA
jgi:hypothetical protein